MITKKQSILIGLLLLCSILLVGSLLIHPKKSSARKHAHVPRATSIPDLQSKIKQQIVNAIEINEIESGSVYVKNFKTNEELTINIQFKYTPASLLKVPLAMSFYKIAESDPEILDKKIIYTKDLNAENIIQDFVPDQKIIIGNEYTTRELIRRILIYSDNEAMRLLLSQIQEEQFTDVYTKLEVVLPRDDTTDNYMIAKDYARFFDSLYHADYNTKADSDTILELLSQATFRKGLDWGVPDDVRIAHKFGEREVAGTSIKQLHDCGIVYAKNAPYNICIMMKAKEFPEQQNAIGEISSLVYKYMSRQQ